MIIFFKQLLSAVVLYLDISSVITIILSHFRLKATLEAKLSGAAPATGKSKKKKRGKTDSAAAAAAGKILFYMYVCERHDIILACQKAYVPCVDLTVDDKENEVDDEVETTEEMIKEQQIHFEEEKQAILQNSQLILEVDNY